jgi:hypothetical protein
LEELGVTEIKRIDFRNAVPLLEAISDESDERLQDVWAAYFANALDPRNRNVTANGQLIDVIRRLEPQDIHVLASITTEELRERRADAQIKKPEDVGMTERALFESLSRLTALGLFSFSNQNLTVWGAVDRPCRVNFETPIGEFASLAPDPEGIDKGKQMTA